MTRRISLFATSAILRATLAAVVLAAIALVIPPAVAAEDGDESWQGDTLTEEELDAGWIRLFDGRTLYGWKAASEVDWRVIDGTIRADQGEVGLLHTTSQWGDFQLKLDVRSAPGTNSGIFLRTPPRPPHKPGRYYEVNIADQGTNDFPTGSLVHRQRAEGTHDSADWQTFDITADGGRFRVAIDGREVVDTTDPRPLGRGYIGLQFRQGRIEFRDIKLRPLNLETIFNGEDLGGWQVIEKFRGEKPTAMEVDVTDEGAIRVTNGPGTLESKGQWKDFVAQLEIYSAGDELNSGVFFRTRPGEDWAGYESQIHNGYTDGDRNEPSNWGTGGIFRRQQARRIVADDHEWFHKTINVTDRHIAVWVNGIQVSDFTDRRPPADNARQGLYDKAGTIQFQGHDPTTDLRFRDIRVGEVPERG